MRNSFFAILSMLLFSQFIYAQSDLVGHWTFDDSQNPLTLNAYLPVECSLECFH